jgi:flagellar P-ring protein precursor FlgI
MEAGGEPVANAQGPLLVSESSYQRGVYTVETSGRIPDGGLLLADLPRIDLALNSRLVLHVPNIATASRIADVINGDLGPNTARVEDPGAVILAPADSAGGGPAVRLARILDLEVEAGTRAQILVDSRDGTVVAGGQVTVGPAVVSHGGLTLTVAGTAQGQPTPGEVRVATGASVQDVAAALHGVGAPAGVIAAIFESLRSVGALVAEVKIR